MYIGLIAKRYATALAEFATANGEESRTYKEVQELIRYYRENYSLRNTLSSPILPAEIKLDIVRKLFAQAICTSLDKFIRLVIHHKREHYLYFMLNSFLLIYRQRHNIQEAKFITAMPLKNEIVKRICTTIERKNHSEVHIHSEEKPELIGGFLFRIDDILIDASLSSQLNRLKQQLCGKTNRIV